MTTLRLTPRGSHPIGTTLLAIAAAFVLAEATSSPAQAQAPAATAAAPAAKLDPPVKPTVTGTYVGNGKPAAIKFVIVTETEPFSDKEAISIIFSEKDPATSKKPDFDAMFGKLGSALILKVFREDGGVFGCQVVHSAHKKQGFSAIGQTKVVDFKIAGGNVSGRVVTDKELEFFGDTWTVDLTFAAPLPAKLRDAAPSTPKPVAKETKPEKKDPEPAGPLVAAHKLPFPKDAADLEFKSMVKQIQFTSPRPVAAVTKEFATNLKQQGWKEGAGNLVGAKNSILKYEQGAAKLTVMINPATAGSTVKIFSEGLDWSEAEAGPSARPPKPAESAKSVEDAIKDADAEAQKAIRDALKGIPAIPGM
jgi:hypothetical protein